MMLALFSLSAFAGATLFDDITMTGSVTAGDWEGTAVGIAYGGTGAATDTLARTALGLKIGTDVQAYDADLATIAGITLLANIQSFLAVADYDAGRTALGLAIGTNVQAYDADLDALGGVTGAANAIPYFTAEHACDVISSSANMISLLGSATYEAARTNIGLGDTSSVVHSNLDLGSSGVVGSLDLFPATGSMGKLAILAANSAGDTTTTLTNASQAGARTYTIPDAGASGYFVMSQAAQSTAGQIDREDLSEDELVVCGVPLTNIVDHDGAAMAAAAATGRFGMISGGYGTGTLTLDGEAASGDSKTSTCMFEFILPTGYQASGDVNLVVTAFEKTGVANTSTTLTAEVYENDGDGTVSADLYGTFDHTDITDSWQTCTSIITDAGLVAGDRLIVFIQMVCNDTGGTSSTVAQIGKVEIRCDVKGS